MASCRPPSKHASARPGSVADDVGRPIYLVGGFEARHQSVLARLGPHKTGQGCLYLKRLDDVDQDALRALIDLSVRVRKGVDRAATQP